MSPEQGPSEQVEKKYEEMTPEEKVAFHEGEINRLDGAISSGRPSEVVGEMEGGMTENPQEVAQNMIKYHEKEIEKLRGEQG